MSLTDEQVAAMGAVDMDAPTPHVRPKRAAMPGPARTTRQVEVNLSPEEYKRAAAVSDRLDEVAGGFGISADPEGSVTLDNQNSRMLTHGLDPEVHREAAIKRFAIQRKRSKANEGETKLSIFGGDDHTEDVGFQSAFGSRMGGFVPPDTKKLDQAQRAWSLIGKIIGPEEEKSGEDPTMYLYASDAGERVKRATRERLATWIEKQARTLPSVVGGDRERKKYEAIARYVRTLDPELLHGAHKAMATVTDLADAHASPPVRDAVKQAVKEQSDPERSSMLEALKVGFGNNVAPMTMGAGSMIAQGLGANGEVRAPGADVITRDPATGLESTTRGAAAPGGPNQTGRDVDAMHAQIVQGMTGKDPQEQAAYIEQLKAEHPRVYALGSVLGWFSDPVGLVGGKLVGGAARAGKAAAGMAGRLGAAAAAGAPLGVLGDQAAGGQHPGIGAALGAGGAVAGELAGAAANKIASVIGNSTKRADIGKITEAGRKVVHELGKEAAWHGNEPKEPLLVTVYRRLEAEFPPKEFGWKRGAPTRDPVSGKMRPGRVPELEHAAEQAVDTAHGHGGSPMAGGHPLMGLASPDVPVATKAMFLGREASEGRLHQGLMAATVGSSKAVVKAADANIAKLVAAIRAGDRHGFRFAVREAAAAGVPSSMIQAAEEAFRKREQMRADAE